MDINALIMIVLFEFVLLALAPSVIDMVDTRECGTYLSDAANLSVCPLENASLSSKVIYALIPMFYAILAIVPIVGVMKFGSTRG